MHSGWSAQVGNRLFDKLRKKNDKQVEVKKSVRTDKRRLAQLCEEPSDSTASPNVVKSLMSRNFALTCLDILTDVRGCKMSMNRCNWTM